MENNHPFNKKINELVDLPDDLVWENIEKELQKKKKRRFIFWMIFVAFTFSSLGYLIDNQFSKSNLSPVNSIENSTVNTNNSNESNQDFNKIVTKLEKTNSDKNIYNDNIEKNKTSNKQEPKKTHQNSNSKNDSKSKIIKKEPKVTITLKEDSINKKDNKVLKTRTLANKKTNFKKKKYYSKKKKYYSKKKKRKTNNTNGIVAKSSDGKVENTSNINDSVFLTNNTLITENTIVNNNIEETKKPVETKKINKKPIKKAQETNEIKTIDQDTLVDREGRRLALIPFVGFSNMAFNNSYSLLSNDIAYQKPSSEFNFQFGVRTRIELAEDVSLSVGVTYYKHSYNNIINYSPNFVWDNNVENFQNVPFTSNELEVKHDIHYLSIPINIEYSIYESKNLHLKTFLGPEFNYLTENTISYKNGNQWIPFANASFLNKAMVNVRTGFIFRQNLTKDWIIELNPELQIPFYMKRKDYFAKPFFYGLTIGTEIKF
jgi:Outer membrane protein beta-barrel domain